jgi:hypothetical protein
MADDRASAPVSDPSTSVSTSASSVAISAAAASSSAPPPPHFSSKSDLKTAILTAIMAERARKAERRKAGLPDTESSSDGEEDEETRKIKQRAAQLKAERAAVSKNDYGAAKYWNQRYTKSVSTSSNA